MPQDNILISAAPHKAKTCKYIDFGLAVEITSGPQITDGKLVGTPGYMAPEIVQRQHYNCTADVWSLGVVMFQMHTGVSQDRLESDAYICSRADFYAASQAQAASAAYPSIDERSTTLLDTMLRSPAERPTSDSLVTLLGAAIEPSVKDADEVQRPREARKEEEEEQELAANDHEQPGREVIDDLQARLKEAQRAGEEAERKRQALEQEQRAKTIKLQEFVSETFGTLPKEIRALNVGREAQLSILHNLDINADANVDSTLSVPNKITRMLVFLAGGNTEIPVYAVLVQPGVLSGQSSMGQCEKAWFAEDDMRLVFLCAYDFRPLGGTAVCIENAKEWAKKAAPLLKITLTAIRFALEAGAPLSDLPFLGELMENFDTYADWIEGLLNAGEESALLERCVEMCGKTTTRVDKEQQEMLPKAQRLFGSAYHEMLEVAKAQQILTKLPMRRCIDAEGTSAWIHSDSTKTWCDHTPGGTAVASSVVTLHMSSRRGFDAARLVKLRALFDHYDVDGNGTLEANELECLIVELGHGGDHTTVRALLAEFGHLPFGSASPSAGDVGERAISFDSFLRLIAKLESEPNVPIRESSASERPAQSQQRSVADMFRMGVRRVTLSIAGVSGFSNADDLRIDDEEDEEEEAGSSHTSSGQEECDAVRGANVRFGQLSGAVAAPVVATTVEKNGGSDPKRKVNANRYAENPNYASVVDGWMAEGIACDWI